MTNVLAVKEGVQYQSSEESISYKIDLAEWTSSPASPSIAGVTDNDGTDVKSTVMPSGNPTISGTEITLPRLTSLTAGKQYRIRVQFQDGNSNTLITVLYVKCLF